MPFQLYGSYLAFFMFVSFFFTFKPNLLSIDTIIWHFYWIDVLVAAFVLPYLGIYSVSKRHKSAISVVSLENSVKMDYNGLEI